MRAIKNRFFIFTLLFLLSLLSQAQHMFFHLLPGFVPAYTWVGLGGDADWTTAANWSTGAVPGVANTAIFNDACISNCDPVLNSALNIAGIDIQSTYSGTIDHSAGLGITIGANGWTQAAGVFVGTADNTNFIIMNGPFSLSGGTYTATAGTWDMSANFSRTGGILNHNNGLINFGSNQTIIPGNTQFFNITFHGMTTQDLSGGSMTANGTLTLDSVSGCCSAALNNGTVQANGNVNILNHGKAGTALLILSGAGNQTLTGSASGKIPSLSIASTGGTVTLTGSINIHGNYTYTSGVTDLTTSAVNFISSSMVNIVTGGIAYNDVTFRIENFAGAGQNLNASTMTVNGALTLNGNATCCEGGLNNGIIHAKGNVNVVNYGRNGTAQLIVSGTGNQSVIGDTVTMIPHFEILSTGGTVSVGGVLLASGDWKWSSGTVDMGASTLVFSNASVITPGPVNYANVTFSGMTAQNLNAGTMNVTGSLIFDSSLGCCGAAVNNGSINASGNVSFTNFGKTGTAILNFTGASNTTLTIAAAAATLDTTHNVAKTAPAKLSLVANTSYAAAGRNFTITTGTLDVAGFAFSVNNLITVSASGRLICNGGTATAASWSLAGEISCGTGQGITWTGAGGDNLWSTATNWTNNNIPGAADIAVFNASVCIAAACNAQINSNLSVRGILLHSTYPGTLTQNATRTLTIGTGGYTQAGGTFAGGNSAIVMNGAYTLSGGIFTATSGTWTQEANFTISGAATFNHNSGSWQTSVSNTISPNGSTFNNVRFEGANSLVTHSLNSGTMIVIGTLQLAAVSTSGSAINSGVIEARGNIDVLNEGKVGSAILRINGAGAQALNATTATNGKVPSLEIDKPSGTLTITGSIFPRGTIWSHLNGTVDASASTLNLTETITIIPGTMVYNHVVFTGSNSAVTQSLSAGTMIVDGNLYLSAVSTVGSAINSGIIEARKDIIVQIEGKVGSAIIRINGAGAQSLDASTAANGKVPNIEINKPSGTLTLSGAIYPRGDTWTHLGGLVDAGTSSLNFIVTTTIIPGPVIYNDAAFGGTSATPQNLNGGTMFLSGDLTLNSTGLTSALNTGTIEVEGNVNVTSEGKTGSALIKFVGAGAQTLDGSTAATAKVPYIEIDKPSGTLTLAGTIAAMANWTWTDGAVAAGTSTIRFLNSNASIVPGSVAYNNVTFAGAAGTQSLNAGTITVNGITSIAGTSGSSILNAGTIEANGNVSVVSSGYTGTAVLKMLGVTSSTLTWTAGSFLSTTVSVEKTGAGSVVLTTNAPFSGAGRSLNVTSGVLDLASFDLTVNNVLTVSAGATLKCSGGEFTAGTLTNLGTVNCQGFSTYDFNWTGAGGNTNWNTAGNWQAGVAPGPSDIVAFQDSTCGGTCNATINISSSVRGVRIYSPYTGTISQGNGNTFTIGTKSYSQAAGTFIGGNAAMDINRNFSLSGGSFTSTSAAMTVRNDFTVSGGAFVHTSPSLITFGGNGTGAVTITPGGIVLNDVTINLSFSNTTIVGTLDVAGNFSHTGTSTAINGGIINVQKNLTAAGSTSGSTQFRMIGSTNQTFSGAGGLGRLEIASTGGTVFISGSTRVYNNFLYTSGNVDASGSTITFGGNGTGALSINSGGVLLNNISVSTSFSNTTITGSLNVAGNILMAGSSTAINGGQIFLGGNYTSGISGSTSVVFNGAGTTQTLTQSAGTFPTGPVAINKSSGSVVLVANTLFNSGGQNLTITSGTLDMAGFNLTVGNNIVNNGILRRGTNPACGTVSQGGSYSGTAAICP